MRKTISIFYLGVAYSVGVVEDEETALGTLMSENEKVLLFDDS